MARIRRRKFYFLVVVVATVFIFGRYIISTTSVRMSRQADVIGVVYDYTIKTEHGRAIKVARVIDGDTVELVNGERLRYIGIDTPEEVDPRKSPQCFAEAAAAANKAMVESKSIIFYDDVSRKDKYGRWLGFVYLSDGTFVNQSLVARGFAFAYPYAPDISHAAEFARAETQAKDARLGLWAACKVFRTSSGREQTNVL